MTIKITGRPNGEAPEWVRDAWIGITLPAERQTQRAYRALGVLSGPSKWSAQVWAMMRGRSFQVSGYAVQARIAVDLLARTNPAAAAWWLENAADLVRGRRLFVFEAEVCEQQVGRRAARLGERGGKAAERPHAAHSDRCGRSVRFRPEAAH